MRFFDHKIISNKGDPIHIIYSPIVDQKGKITLEVSGKENTDVIIDSYRDQTDINIIISRVRNGETDLLNKTRGMYGDFTKLPKSFAEMLQLQIDSEKKFMSLPKEVREKFNNDKNEFFVQAGSEMWFKNLGIELKEEKQVDQFTYETEVKE